MEGDNSNFSYLPREIIVYNASARETGIFIKASVCEKMYPYLSILWQTLQFLVLNLYNI